jgi:hypothetical protein
VDDGKSTKREKGKIRNGIDKKEIVYMTGIPNPPSIQGQRTKMKDTYQRTKNNAYQRSSIGVGHVGHSSHRTNAV